MMTSIPESSIFFSISHDCVTVTVTGITPLSHFITYVIITHNVISYLLSKSKIKKSKIKLKIK